MHKLLFLLFVSYVLLIFSANATSLNANRYQRIIPPHYFNEDGSCKYPYPACTIPSDG